MDVGDITVSNSYIVKAGDSLYTIAKKFGTTVEAIMRENNLTSSAIYPGQKLMLPTLPLGIYGLGSRGEDVRTIQQALVNMGFRLTADGIYGPMTQRMIRSIQQKYPETLTADGIYGPKTRTVLQSMRSSGYRIVQNPAALTALVNKTHALPPDYIPPGLVTPKVPANAGFTLRTEAAGALEQLFKKAAEDNISLYGISAYRSYDPQAELFAANVQRNPNANRTSARPGESEHQTGLSADISSPAAGYGLTQSFGDTAEGRWLRENAPEFGFIIRFPQGKESITGYSYEPWHIRYVGKDTARRIAARNIALEEL